MVPTYSDYSIYAELKVGANGKDEGIPELTAGDAAGDIGYAYNRWDSDVTDGVDSDWVQVQLVADPSGVTWTVGQASPVHVTANSAFGEVLALKVRATVQGGDRQTSWRDLVVSFYQSADADLGTPSEQMMVGRSYNPIASTFDQGPDASADDAREIQPEGSGYEKVMVTASVRIQSLAGVMPSPDAMFAQVYVYGQPPTAPSASPTPVYVAMAAPEEPTVEPTVVSITNFTEDLTSTELELLA